MVAFVNRKFIINGVRYPLDQKMYADYEIGKFLLPSFKSNPEAQNFLSSNQAQKHQELY
jgi:hypothetical protein